MTSGGPPPLNVNLPVYPLIYRLLRLICTLKMSSANEVGFDSLESS